MKREAFQIAKKGLSPDRFLVMECKTVDSVNNDGNASEFCCQTTQETCFGVMGVDDVITVIFQKEYEIHKGQHIPYRVEWLHQIVKCPHTHIVLLNQIYQPPPGCTGQFCLIDPAVHPPH